MNTSKAGGAGASIDRLGMFASTACALHCGVSALLPGALGVLGAEALFGHEAEWAFTLVAITFAALALGFGYFRHRRAGVATLLLAGILGLLLSRALEGFHHDVHAAESAAHSTSDDDHAEAPHPTDEGVEAEGPLGHAGADRGVWSHRYETMVGIFAGLLLVTGHVLNKAACRCC